MTKTPDPTGVLSEAASLPRFFTVVALTLFALAMPALADIERDDAVEILDAVLKPGSLAQDAESYLMLTTLSPGQVVAPFGDPDRAVTLTKQVWLGYIDDHPSGFFSHRVRFVFIDVVTGEVQVSVQRWWPLVDGEPVFDEESVEAEPELLQFSSLTVTDEGIEGGGE